MNRCQIFNTINVHSVIILCIIREHQTNENTQCIHAFTNVDLNKEKKYQTYSLLSYKKIQKKYINEEPQKLFSTISMDDP